MLTAMDVSKYIVSKCYEDGYPITNVELQKYLYFIQYEFLKNIDQPLFEDDFEAWAIGSVIENVYYYFALGGVKAIKFPFKDKDYEEIINDKAIKDIINSKIKYMQEWDFFDIVWQLNESHNAWHKIYSNKSLIKKIIPKELIKKDKYKKRKLWDKHSIQLL